MWKRALTGGTLAVAQAATLAAQAPSTDVWLAPLDIRDGRITVGTPLNVSARPGYDNQPSFTRDGKRLYFTTSQGGAPSEIERYDIRRKTLVNATNSTVESEYSAQQLPGKAAFGSIVVEADSTQRLWQVDEGSAKRAVIFEKLKPVGYWAATDDRTFAMFVLGSPPALVLGDRKTGKVDTVATNIGRAVQRIPNERAFSFTQRAPDSTWRIRRVDAVSHQVTDIATALPGAQDMAWTPTGRIFMGKGNVLYARSPGADTSWVEARRFEEPGLRQISRIAVSPVGNYVALVSTEAQLPEAGTAQAPTNHVRPEPPAIRPTPDRSAIVTTVINPAAPTTLIIVRHAEKAAPGGDPALSIEGTARAQVLAQAISGAQVTGVIVTPYKRTQGTAAPLATERGLTPIVMPVAGGVAEHAAAIIDSARARFGGGTVLIVGHTNTIPAIVAAAGAPHIEEPCESQYDGMWIVRMPASGPATLITSRYGAPSPADSSCSTMRTKP